MHLQTAQQKDLASREHRGRVVLVVLPAVVVVVVLPAAAAVVFAAAAVVLAAAAVVLLAVAAAAVVDMAPLGERTRGGTCVGYRGCWWERRG